MRLSGIERDSVLIERIEPVIYKTEEVQPRWSLDEPNPDCGGFTTRKGILQLRAGEGMMLDYGDSWEVGDDERMNQFGSFYSISDDDQMGMRVAVGACDARYYEFGLDITYSLRGVEYHEEVGSETPFKIIGGDATEHYLSSGSPYPTRSSRWTRHQYRHRRTRKPASCTDWTR